MVRRACRAFVPAPEKRSVLQQEITTGLKNRDPVFFVQVGSNDGVQGDPLRDLIVSNRNWRGIFIEPVGYLYDKLIKNYGDSHRFIFERLAISSSRGTSDFYYVSEKARAELGDALPYWYDQLGSFSRAHILKHLDGMLEPYIVSRKVEVSTLQDVLEKNEVSKLDLLHIDTEGHDYEVLSALDFSRYKPTVILYEHKHLSAADRNAADALLEEHGYLCKLYEGDTLGIIQA